MSGSLYLGLPGAFYHVTARARCYQTVFSQPDDFQYFIAGLGDVCTRFHWYCHAFCLLSHQYDLIIETPDANLPVGMRHLHAIYSRYGRQRHIADGYSLKLDFQARLLDADNYLPELVRYIMLKPVHAGLVRAVGQWPWSSYRYMLGQQLCPLWFNVRQVLSLFAAQRALAQRRYMQFIADAAQRVNLWRELQNKIYLHEQDFVLQKQLLGMDQHVRLEIPLLKRRGPVHSLAFYARHYPSKTLAMRAAYASGCYTLEVIADYFNVDYKIAGRTLKN